MGERRFTSDRGLGVHLNYYHTKKADASAMRTKLRRKKKFSCFVVYEKKGRCFSPSAQKMLVLSTEQIKASTSVVHSEALHMLMER